MKTERAELRLELLKLTYTHGRESTEAVSRAKILEDFILEESESADGKPAQGAKTLPTGKVKKAGNPDILS